MDHNISSAVTPREWERVSRPIGRSVNDICDVEPFGKTTIRRAIREGALRARRCGRKVIILEDDFQEWVRSLPTHTTSRQAA